LLILTNDTYHVFYKYFKNYKQKITIFILIFNYTIKKKKILKNFFFFFFIIYNKFFIFKIKKKKKTYLFVIIFCSSKTLDQFLGSLKELSIDEVKEKSNNKNNIYNVNLI